jgi:hypothetical protein
VRKKCKPFEQEEEKKEPCTMRNISYESEWKKCNPPGSRRSSDKEGLQERRDTASLYVGEFARSLHERGREHWRDADMRKEESHMMEHEEGAHREVREAVRIQMRGNVLNKKGTYNRCNLTRMVADEEWDKKMLEEAWEPRDERDTCGPKQIQEKRG